MKNKKDIKVNDGGKYKADVGVIRNSSTNAFAIVDNNNKLIGYLAYVVDYYCSKAYNFGLISFDKGNVILGRDLFNKMEELVSTLHKIEWRMVGGNPVERSYDKFCFKHNGKKHILKDSIRDAQGNYRDDIIYEIINER